MRIAVVGDGPAGLTFAASMKSSAPGSEVTLWGRPPHADNGFGLVLPARTVEGIAEWDPVVGAAVLDKGVGWSRIDVSYRGSVVTSKGHDYVSIGRRELLDAMQNRCRDLGVDMRVAPPPSLADLRADVDVLVGADGLHSPVRGHWAEDLQPQIAVGRNRFLWTSAPIRLDSFTFYVIESRFGTIILHAYPYRADRSVVIVEVSSGSLTSVANPELIDLVQTVLGAPLDPNSRYWQQFSAVSLQRWHTGNVVVIGDAAHATHFSIGSGTKMAIEDGRTLAQCLAGDPVEQALAAYQARRRPAVTALQDAAAASTRWFERIDQHLHCPPLQFAERLMGRAGRASNCHLIESSRLA
jgi:anthraniloyl-CoA monooxygenase